jgi:hypothetical protein
LIRYVKLIIGAKGFTDFSKFNPFLTIFKIPSFSETCGHGFPTNGIKPVELLFGDSVVWVWEPEREKRVSSLALALTLFLVGPAGHDPATP